MPLPLSRRAGGELQVGQRRRQARRRVGAGLGELVAGEVPGGHEVGAVEADLVELRAGEIRALPVRPGGSGRAPCGERGWPSVVIPGVGGLFKKKKKRKKNT